MLSKNLIKASQFILKEKEPVIVNSNELLAKKIEFLSPKTKQGENGGFRSGLNAPEVDPLFVDAELGEGLENPAMEEIPPEPVYTGPTPEELIAQAEEEIQRQRQEAESQIAAMKEAAVAEGKQLGYEEGRQEALKEAAEANEKLERKALELEQEYQKLVDELEPKFIRTITGVYEEIFQVELTEYKNILSHAIANTIRRIEGTKDFLVHVSREDYEKLEETKAEWMEKLPSGQISVELIEDATLGANQCMIETNSGIFDCGIGTQLEELTRKLRLLSYEG